MLLFDHIVQVEVSETAVLSVIKSLAFKLRVSPSGRL